MGKDVFSVLTEREGRGQVFANSLIFLTPYSYSYPYSPGRKSDKNCHELTKIVSDTDK